MLIRLLALVVFLAVGTAGVLAVLLGIGDQHAANTTYIAYFGSSGDGCEAEVHFDEATGKVLACNSGDFTVNFPGFTDAQNNEIEALAKKLGADRLEESDQVRIQRRIDELAATVPASARPYPGKALSVGPLWGSGMAWTGALALLLSVLGTIMLMRPRFPARRQRF